MSFRNFYNNSRIEYFSERHVPNSRVDRRQTLGNGESHKTHKTSNNNVEIIIISIVAIVLALLALAGIAVGIYYGATISIL